MEYSFLKAKESEFEEIYKLYQDVISSSFTTWDENYPSKSLIKNDIASGNLFVLKDKSKIIAVSYLGKNENENENWAFSLNNPLGIARICVSSQYQKRGVGSFFVKKLIKEAKTLGADGMHFHVCTKNLPAMKMYEKCFFINCGLGKSNYGFDYYKYELKFD